MFLAFDYIPKNAPICYILDDGIIFLCHCQLYEIPIGYTIHETRPGELVEFSTNL